MKCRLILLAALAAPLSASAGPAFCAKPSGKAEQAICAEPALRAAEHRLDQVFEAALAKVDARQRQQLGLEQKGWWRGVQDCWKAEDLQACIAAAYALRTVELQAQYWLAPARGPFVFACDDGSTVKVTHFQTEPPSLIAERGAAQVLMRSQPSASGARYAGRNEQFWEHQGSATVVWGYGAPELQCKRR